MIHGLYAITTGLYLDRSDLLTRTEQALRGGARVVQYRDKEADAQTRHDIAVALLELCRDYRVVLIINDDIALAAQVGADGVHLGEHDDSIAEARRQLPDNALVGVSCYSSMRRAVQAQQHGASYVAFGSVFASETKPLAARAPLKLIETAQHTLDVAVVAIGGITLNNAATVVNAGADAIAVISSLYEAKDVEAAAQGFAALYETERGSC